jgi:molecular chaperone HscB
MQNFFTLFELEEQYNIDPSLLNIKYFSLLAKYHPDKASSSKEKYEYFTSSSIINNGYKILLDDFERAAHILELHGINIKNDSQAPKLPFDILEEILDMKERLESARNQEEEQKNRDLSTEKRKAILAALPSLFDAKNYQAAAIETMKLKYYR